MNRGSKDPSHTGRGTGDLFEAVGMADSPTCGDVVKVVLFVDRGHRILDTGFRVFGCGSAMARTAQALRTIQGKTVDEAWAIAQNAVTVELSPDNGNGGCVAAEQAVLAALEEYAVQGRPSFGS